MRDSTINCPLQIRVCDYDYRRNDDYFDDIVSCERGVTLIIVVVAK